MIDTYIMQYNYRNKYLVVIDGNVYVYEYDKYKCDPPYLSFNPKHIPIGKSKVCDMTECSGTVDNDSDFEGNTLLLEVGGRKYVYISGLEITEFRTDDKIQDYLSLMGNNTIPYANILGGKYTYFIYHCYKFIDNNKTVKRTLIIATNASLDP